MTPTGPRPGQGVPRVAAVGLVAWNRLIVVARYPAAGSSAIVRRTASLPGGTTANSALALARLGAEVAIVALIGADAEGAATRAALERAGVNTHWLTTVDGVPTDGATVVIGTDPPDRTIFWHQGARLSRGDRLDVAAIFSHDVVLLDVADPSLRRFLVDLPAHTLPAARLLGTLTYLVDLDLPDALAIALRHDVIVGNQRELMALTLASTLDAAIAAMRAAMPGSNLRVCVISRGDGGATAFTASDRWDTPAMAVEVVDTLAAGDAFAGAIAYAMALRRPWPATIRFANAVAALSARALGGQTALPTPSEVASLLGEDPFTLGP